MESCSERKPKTGEVTIERLEPALALCAYLVVLDGPVIVPLFERLARELEALRASEDTMTGAKR
jgi:hypothetical protein